jgi:hypothetical protein
VVKERSEGLAPAAAELYAHGPVLLAAARAMTVNDADAQDLVQATFEIAIRSLASLRDPAANVAPSGLVDDGHGTSWYLVQNEPVLREFVESPS